jgi:AcrR family transcriptional regulator
MMSHSNSSVATGEWPSIGQPCREVAADPVLSAAFDGLVHFGPNRMTLTDVARRAGVSRMTVYRRYDTLSKLVSAVLTAELVDLLEHAQADVRPGTDAQRIAGLVADAASRIARHPVMSRLLHVEPEALLPVIVQRKGSTQSAAEHILAHTIASSSDGTVTVADPQRAAAALVTAASGFVFTSGHVGQPERWDELEALAYGYLTAVRR